MRLVFCRIRKNIKKLQSACNVFLHFIKANNSRTIYYNILVSGKIIGKGKNFLDLKNYIKNNNLKENVELLGYKEHPWEYAKQFNVFVLTSKYEGLPNVLLEAINENKIIVSTDCASGPKEILDNHKGGFLFPVNDYVKLANILNYIYYNKNKALKKNLFAKKNLLKFNYKTNLEKYKNIINKYLN